MQVTRPWTIASVWLLALAVTAPAAAQNTGTVSGTIVDNSAQVVPGATVSLTNERTADTRTSTTDARGEFAFRAVPPGSYAVKVELSGFRTLETRSNILNASGQLDLGQMKLDVGALSEIVTVVSEGTVVETKNSDYSGLLTSTQISQIQTKGRDVMSLLRLLPGVKYENDVEAMGDSFGTNVPNISGNRRAWNQVTVDGLNGNELSGTARFSSAINLDAIAEVKVLLNTYKAEFGRTGGANIQIVSKSGTNQYRGSGYWYGRREAWNATPWENNRTNIDKPKYHFDTYGANIGGPFRIPGVGESGGDRRLFFFYSLEAPQVQRPGPLRLYRMPTDLERNGDFSQTRNAAGGLVFIKDPTSTAACNVTTGGPGCFPNNRIPDGMIDPNTRRLLAMLPLPNRLDHNATANWNFARQETSDNPRWNNLLRIDARPSGNDNFWGVLRTFNSNQYGSEITAGPTKWGYFNGAYIFSDSSINGGWNKILGSSFVNELQTGIRRQTEGFQTHQDSDWTHVRRSDIGWNVPQYFPDVNTLDVMPRVTFGLTGTGIDSPDFSFDQRLGETAQDWLYSIRDTATWNKGRHTIKAGGYFEFMHNNEARGGAWMGEFTFNNNTNNPLNTNHAFANALLGVFGNYQETATPGSTRNRAWMSEFYAQDTWQVSSRLTLDYGARFLWYAPYWRVDDRVSNFDENLFDPARAPRLYQPAIVNGTRVAFDPVTGQTQPIVFIGAYVPNTGNPTNGLVNGGDGVPRGFRETLAPQIEPRLGATWDITGEGTTVVHASTGLFHNARLGGGSFGNLRNPPFFVTPALPNATIGTMFAPGVSLSQRPPNINGITWDYESPSTYNWTVGIRRDIGWGTVVDATYIGSKGRHLEGQYRPQRGARRRAIPGRQPAERRSVAGRPPGVGRRVPAPVSRLRHDPRARQLRRVRLSLVPDPGEPPVHPRRPVWRVVHLAARARHPGRGRRRTIDRAQPADGLLLFGGRSEPGPQRGDQLHLGSARDQHVEPRAARDSERLADLRRERVRHRRVGPREFLDGGQLRFHRRRWRTGRRRQRHPARAAERDRQSDGRRRRPDYRLVQHGGVQPAHRPRRHRQLEAQRRAAPRHQQLGPRCVQELPVRWRARVPVPRRGVQRAQSHAVQRHRSRRAVQRCRSADRSEFRNRYRNWQPDASAAHHPAVAPLELLTRPRGATPSPRRNGRHSAPERGVRQGRRAFFVILRQVRADSPPREA